MKKILLIAAVVALSAVASYSQGLVSINLSSGNLVTLSSNGVSLGKAFGSGANAYYYELLISPSLVLPGSASNIKNPANLALWSDSTVSGVSGATSLHGGWVTAGTSVAATGWTAPGAIYDNEMSYLIVGWSAGYGTNWTQFATSLGSGLANGGYFGTTAVSLNYAGGGNVPLPAVTLWGNQTGTTGFGVTSGLILQQVTIIPEPTTMALVGLGGLSLLLFRRRK